MTSHSLLGEYGKYLAEKGQEHPDLVVLEADLKEATQSYHFEKRFPDRYLQVGIAEQNMVGIAAGLSLGGKIPFVHSFATFISMRACEQVRTSVAYPGLNVKLIGSFSGLSAGSAGPTHHAVEDIAIMRAIPNMTVLVPGDVREMKQVVDAALNLNGPVYVRLGAVDVDDGYNSGQRFKIGTATELRSGHDAAIVSTGSLVREALWAADILKNKNGINVRVLQMASIKPFDVDAIVSAADETGYLLTLEEHSIIGGLGSCVCEAVAENCSARVRRIGIRDAFCGVGTRSHLLASQGLTVDNIAAELLNLMKNVNPPVLVTDSCPTTDHGS
jgi:transketolase